MKYLLILLFIVTVHAVENPYDAINNRNAFVLLDRPEIKTLPPITDILSPPIKLHLTGITKLRGVTNVYFFSKEIKKRFITLNFKKRTDEGITLLDVTHDLVEVNNNGVVELLSFDTHRLPNTLVLPVNKPKPTIVKESKKDKQSKKVEPSTPRASIVKVPSRRPTVDPRIIEKSLEYISKIDDDEKKNYLLKRIENLQNGQLDIKSNINRNERRRQYDERQRKKE